MLVSHFEANFQSIGVRLPSYMHIYKTTVLRHREIPLQRKTERVLYVINSSIELSWEEKNTVYIGDFVLFISTHEMVLIEPSLPEKSQEYTDLFRTKLKKELFILEFSNYEKYAQLV